MRAAMITEHTGPEAVKIVEVPEPEAGKGQVVVDVAYAGVNFPDLLMSRGLYQIRPPLPFPPGGEIAGRISAIGEGVSDWEVGDSVMALSFYGGFVEKMAVEAATLLPVPEGMPLDVAACFGFTYATSYHGLVDRARIEAGETLLVLGAAGGVGLAAVEIGAALGAKVIAAASSDEKLALTEAHGATAGIRYDREDVKKRAKALSGGGVDIVYDPVGGAFSEAALRALRPGGRHLVIGFAAGEIPAVRLNLVLLKQCQVVGVAWGAWALQHREGQAANMRALFELWQKGALQPVVQRTYPLEEAGRALEDLDARRVLGKIAIAL